VNIKDTIAAINQMLADRVIEQFIEAGALDPTRFQGIVARHGLLEAWQRFEKQFLGDTP
jgi:hypothetical protein